MLAIYLVLLGLALFSGWFILYKVPYINASVASMDENTNCSIIIPARNEAENLPILLASLKQQSIQPYEIIVADDGSTDQTAKIARDFGAQIIQVADENEDWVGKSAGCFAGAKAAKGDWLLFLDADTFLPEEDSLAQILQTFGQQNKEGLLSIQPYHVIQRPYENLSAVFNILVLAGMNRFSYLKDKLEPGGAFGPSLLCTRATYFEMGGHQSVKDSIMENVALGEIFIENDRPVYLYGGKGTVHFRMYPAGLASVGKGWAKSFASGSTSTHPLILTAISLWIAGAFVSVSYLLIALWLGQAIPLIVALIGYCAYFLLLYRMARRTGNFHRYALFFYPILFLYFVGVFIISGIKTFLIGSVSWKGRKMEV